MDRLPGLDGQKMGYSAGNAIYLNDSPGEVKEKVNTAVTDPARIRATDKGHPEICNIYRLHQYFNQSQLAEQCRLAKIGCVDCKKLLAQEINTALGPFRERRTILAAKPQHVIDVLAEGAQQARAIAKETFKEVKQRIGLI